MDNVHVTIIYVTCTYIIDVHRTFVKTVFGFQQGYYNCLRQGSDLTPKIWSFCTLEFTVHSALFEPVWFVIVLQVSTQHFLFRFSISSLRSISSLHCLQTARNKAECTVNSKVQKDQILGATPYPCRRQL